MYGDHNLAATDFNTGICPVRLILIMREILGIESPGLRCSCKWQRSFAVFITNGIRVPAHDVELRLTADRFPEEY
jgi:hypothetical protein